MDFNVSGWTPGEITLVAPSTGVLTMSSDASCSFTLVSDYSSEWLGDGSATLNVVEGQSYTIIMSHVDYGTATFTVTFAMAGSTDIPAFEGAGTEASPYVIPGDGEYTDNFAGGMQPLTFYSYTATANGTLSVVCTYNAGAFWSINDNAGSNPTQSVEMTAGQTVVIWFTSYNGEAAEIPFKVTFTAA